MDKERYLAAFKSFQTKVSLEPSWIGPIKKNAMSRFVEMGFPTQRDEEWKYTNVEPIAKEFFRFPFEVSLNGVTSEKIKPFFLDEKGTKLVFLTSQFRKDWSSISSSEIQAGSLKEVLVSHAKDLEPYLAKLADFQKNSFTALNTAFFSDGAFLSIEKQKAVKEPIQLLFVSSAHEEKVTSQPRNLILVGEGAEATLVESHFSLSEEPYFTNTVTEIFLAPGAKLTRYLIQMESPKAYHVETTHVHQAKGSHFSSFVFSFGAKLSRNNLSVALDSEGAGCELEGLYMVSDHQHVDHHTLIDHLKPYGTSRQVYKGVLGGQAKAVFNGKILVRKDAQKTDAHQLNKNLLLSENAVVDAKPQLEIFADDVKCTHGAAIGQLADEEIFYVKSRGIGEEHARRLLTFGFAGEILEQVKLGSLRSRLENWVTSNL